MISVYNHSTCPPWLLLSPKSLYHILCALQKNITMSVSRGYEDNDQFQHLQKRRREAVHCIQLISAHGVHGPKTRRPQPNRKDLFCPCPQHSLGGVDREPRKICDTLFSLFFSFPHPFSLSMAACCMRVWYHRPFRVEGVEK